MALQRYASMPVDRRPQEIEREIAALERELSDTSLPERAATAVRKNLELKRRLLASFSEVEGTIKTLLTELDSMESLLEVLHQNSISLRDPQAISEELDTIVRQSEDTERIVREMETLLRTDTAGWSGDLAPAGAIPAPPAAEARPDMRRPVKRR
jgi:signal transduction histidine kinase